MISLHFWGAAYGGGTMIAMLLFGGVAYGLSLDDPEALFSQVIETGEIYAISRTIAWSLVVLGQIVFTLHFLLMLLRIGQPGGQATLFAPIEEETH